MRLEPDKAKSGVKRMYVLSTWVCFGRWGELIESPLLSSKKKIENPLTWGSAGPLVS